MCRKRSSCRMAAQFNGWHSYTHIVTRFVIKWISPFWIDLNWSTSDCIFFSIALHSASILLIICVYISIEEKLNNWFKWPKRRLLYARLRTKVNHRNSCERIYKFVWHTICQMRILLPKESKTNRSWWFGIQSLRDARVHDAIDFCSFTRTKSNFKSRKYHHFWLETDSICVHLKFYWTIKSHGAFNWIFPMDGEGFAWIRNYGPNEQWCKIKPYENEMGENKRT